MATRVLLTIDTELVWRHHAAGLGWADNLDRSYEAAGVGVPYQLAVLAEHGLKACFFVDPMPALVHGLEPVRRMVEPILAAGQEVQLHLHPFWARLAAGDPDPAARELNDYSAVEQLAMIRTARDLLIAAGAPPPTAFRAGSYAANADTLAALASLGIRYDSSHNGSYHPRVSRVPLAPAVIAPHRIGPVVEVPIGQMEDGRGRLRHLQLCALSFSELRAALEHAAASNHPAATIVSHSFELATRDGLRPNVVVQRRFLRLCRYLAGNADRLPTARFCNLDGVRLGAPSAPAAGNPVSRVQRMTGQAWGRTCFEDPRLALAIAGSSMVAAAGMAIGAE